MKAIKLTHINGNSNAAATVAKVNMVVALSAAAALALVFGGASASANAGSFAPATSASSVKRPAASVQLADPSTEEINKAMFPEKYFKKLSCKTDTDCEKAATKRILSLESKIAKLQARINKAGASIVSHNNKMQLMKAELKHLQDDSKQ